MRLIKTISLLFLMGIITYTHAGLFGRKKLKRRQSSRELAQELLAQTGRQLAHANHALIAYREQNPNGPEPEALQAALIAAQKALERASREAESEAAYHNSAAHNGASIPPQAQGAPDATPDNPDQPPSVPATANTTQNGETIYVSTAQVLAQLSTPNS